MAQKDILAIANYMDQINESVSREDESYRKACREEDMFYAEEDASLADELEDEIIDKSTMGFIDDSSCIDEYDDDIDEDDVDPYEEDISDCLPLDEEDLDAEIEPIASFELPAFNDNELIQNFLNTVKQVAPDAEAIKSGSIDGCPAVKVTGTLDDLKKAICVFYGVTSYDELTDNQRKTFEDAVVFEDGDTLAEADYREALAHSLDPIGVNASTANLKAVDTCMISMLREEKAKRDAEHMMKCLNEKNVSDLNDEELNILIDMTDDEGLDDEDDDEVEASVKGDAKKRPSSALSDEKLKDMKLQIQKEINIEQAVKWYKIIHKMGLTYEKWKALPPDEKFEYEVAYALNMPIEKFRSLTDEKQQEAYDKYIEISSPSNHMYNYFKNKTYVTKHPEDKEAVDPNDVYQAVFTVNPWYTKETSPLQQPQAQKKAIKKARQENAISDALDRIERIQKYLRKKDGYFNSIFQQTKNPEDKKTWNTEEFQYLWNSFPEQVQKQVFNEISNEIRNEHGTDKKGAIQEIMFLKTALGGTDAGKKGDFRNITLRDLAELWTYTDPDGKTYSPSGVKNFSDIVMRIINDTVDEVYEKYFGKKLYLIDAGDQKYRRAFAKILDNKLMLKDFKEMLQKNLNKRIKRKIVAGSLKQSKV